ncbi:MAG TPA: sigma factor-like helix-turn-helix DNA-binding protein [Candidatus Binataceae bacterium]|nr:sigma factor-like helix-turn-helix DNA-binding protein [Candidatus Binataceae bacterium]
MSDSGKSLYRLRIPGGKKPLSPADYRKRVTRIAQEFAHRIENAHLGGLLGDILAIVQKLDRPVTRREVEQELGIADSLAVYGRLWLLARRGLLRVWGGTPSPHGPRATLFRFVTDKSPYKVRKAQEWLEGELSKLAFEAESLPTYLIASRNFAGSDRNKQIVDMYAKGVRTSEIAQKLGITRERVRQIVAAAINRRTRNKPVSPRRSKRR